jgi:hypothetical protein
MTAAAEVSTAGAILAIVGLVLGVVVLGLVVTLFNRVVRPAREIDRYASDILEAGNGIAANLEGAAQLERTRELGTAVPGLANAYVQKLQGGES